MRAFVDIVENLTSSFRNIVGTIVFGIMAVGGMIALSASYVGTKAVDSLGERAERVTEQAIAAELEARRAEEMAKDGWGYRPRDRAAPSTPPDPESVKNGWGN